MQKLRFLHLVQCFVFDTNGRRLINVALFVSFRVTKIYKLSVAVNTCFQLPNWHDGIFFFFKALGLVFFYGLELIFKVRVRFRIRINTSWQFAHRYRRYRLLTCYMALLRACQQWFKMAAQAGKSSSGHDGKNLCRRLFWETDGSNK